MSRWNVELAQDSRNRESSRQLSGTSYSRRAVDREEGIPGGRAGQTEKSPYIIQNTEKDGKSCGGGFNKRKKSVVLWCFSSVNGFNLFFVVSAIMERP